MHDVHAYIEWLTLRHLASEATSSQATVIRNHEEGNQKEVGEAAPSTYRGGPLTEGILLIRRN